MKLPESLNLYVEGFLSEEDALRQQRTAQLILERLVNQPGIILGDEVGMGKTFVALAVASAHIMESHYRPVVVMVPPNVVDKWKRDAETFRTACLRSEVERKKFRVAIAESGIDFLKLLDDPASVRASLIVLSHSALHRKLADKWVKLAVLQASIKGRHGAPAIRQRLARFAPMVLGHTNKVDEYYELYLALLNTDPLRWKPLLVEAGFLNQEDDDPVPKVLLRTLDKMDLSPVFTQVVQVIPERDSKSLQSRIKAARSALDNGKDGVLPAIWKDSLKLMRLSLPLLILDEAHRVRNAGTQLAALLSAEREDLNRVGGQLNERFERMLFLTATPFQLGHAELRNVLTRFESIDWRGKRPPVMSRNEFEGTIEGLHQRLDSMQLATERLEMSWKRLVKPDVGEAEERFGSQWWLLAENEADPECLNVANERLRSVMLAHRSARLAVRDAEENLKLWVVRHTKGIHLPSPHGSTLRRIRIDGADVQLEANGEASEGKGGGLKVREGAALPFLLGARLSTLPDVKRVFGEGLASSYEALLDTRREEVSDEVEEEGKNIHGGTAWYVNQLRDAAQSMRAQSYRQHPKMKATIELAMSLWRKGEKVLIFCHFRETGAALHRYLSQAMIDEIDSRAAKAIGCSQDDLHNELRRFSDNFKRDRGDGHDRRAAKQVMELLNQTLEQHPELHDAEIRESIYDIVLRFLRTPTFLVRYADLTVKEIKDGWVEALFSRTDASGMSFRQVIEQFLRFLSKRTNQADRLDYLHALKKLQTGSHVGAEVDQSLKEDLGEGESSQGGRFSYVANVRRVYGRTAGDVRKRLMLTFNTPFYPEILIASSVMAESVDLHLNCRHVIHHDLDWNPSSLEQRTGRIDRLGSKAELSGESIRVYLPYVEGCQDEKLYRVVMDRERWFGVVMGAEESMSRVLKASAWEIERMAEQPPLPMTMVDGLRMRLSSA